MIAEYLLATDFTDITTLCLCNKEITEHVYGHGNCQFPKTHTVNIRFINKSAHIAGWYILSFRNIQGLIDTARKTRAILSKR